MNGRLPFITDPKRRNQLIGDHSRSQGDRVFETYWTTIRGMEAMDYNYALMDLTVYRRQERWEDSPSGWPQQDIMETLRTNGRHTAQWSRVHAGRSDDLGTGC